MQYILAQSIHYNGIILVQLIQYWLIMHDELTGAKSASFNSCVNFLYSTRSYVTKQTGYKISPLSLLSCPDCLSHDIVEKESDETCIQVWFPK